MENRQRRILKKIETLPWSYFALNLCRKCNKDTWLKMIFKKLQHSIYVKLFFFTCLHKFWVPTPYVCLVPPIHACKNNSDENQAQNFRQTITSDR